MLLTSGPSTVVHALGVRLERDDSLDIAAPFGFDDVFQHGYPA
jgi:hypothetical protein